MVYITVKQQPSYHQITLDELLSGDYHVTPISMNTTNTRTYRAEHMPDKLRYDMMVCAGRLRTSRLSQLVNTLKNFNAKYSSLFEVERDTLYHTFHIPKKSGGMRRIDEPVDSLMDALRELKRIFETDFGAVTTYHTSAFAYIKGRSTIDAVRRHQANDSKWFAKFDLSNFFGSTTKEFLMAQLETIYPFNVVCINQEHRKELERAIDLCFWNGGLPQGTPMSPLLTNIMMVPIDLELCNGLRDLNGHHYVYTRYADDFIVSSRHDFDINEVQKLIEDTLVKFNAPFALNKAKTRYGSSAGRNWNLGLMLNSNNEITVGSKAKRQFKAMMNSFILDTKHGKSWPRTDVQQLDGYRNYYSMVEKETIRGIILHLDKKYGVNSVRMIRECLKS